MRERESVRECERERGGEGDVPIRIIDIASNPAAARVLDVTALAGL